MPSLSASAAMPVARERIDELRTNFRNQLLPRLKQRRGLVLTITAAIIAVVATLFFWSGQENLRPLFGSQERYNTANIIDTLTAGNIPYTLHPSSGQILVDESLLPKARMTLAANGVTPDIPSGMELLSPNGELGRSQFVEQARYKQGLEGEVARTIISMSAVRNARIHLAIPERTSFMRETPEITASVFLDIYPGARLREKQIQAIVNLVSGSVPGLEPDNVSVMDQNGNSLSASTADSIPEWQEQHTRKREAALAHRITALLEPVVGPGNLRVQVTADIDYNSSEVVKESYDPQSQVVRSESLSTDEQTAAPAKGVPGVESNRVADAAENNKLGRSSSKTLRNYDVDKTISRNTKTAGSLDKLSIGIVVNSLAAEGDNGWTPEALETMTNLVSNAVGIENTRGDTISLYSLPFSSKFEEEDPNPWYMIFEGENSQYVISGLAAVVLLFLGLLLRIQSYRRKIAKERKEAEARQKALTSEESKDAAEAGLVIAVHPHDKTIERARQLTINNPEQVAMVLQQWIDKQ
ncbi:flagellar M-ring protein FliF [Sansalvadorimonas sp. 2012CJ34-2]|uniref:Flagellar M-ring protein n=1 Tax=Parendozoicomonas callyspongiae TaxID=2942213 RepID=A0ABT0PFG1_9GAMM|nr:flagellar basal-body MS-ring/collar protein FliF [Sansalvadorimonas sp. 2012CJ34-2]MCL6270124.1 flagellar M-ring protein FliF [Sansalvadorimonas sp. 2012CJ34-2]